MDLRHGREEEGASSPIWIGKGGISRPSSPLAGFWLSYLMPRSKDKPKYFQLKLIDGHGLS